MTKDPRAGAVADDRGLVSVVIPCFNAAPFLHATLASVLQQRWRRLEVLVVDDCSTDGSAQIVEAVAARDPRVRLIALARNHGAPAAPRNHGIRAARGEWIALLDADDLWHPRKLELQLQALAAQQAEMCSTRMLDFHDDAELLPADVVEPLTIERITLRGQLLKYRTPTSSIVVRRALLLAHPFNEDLSYKAREDTDCFIRLHEYMPYSIKLVHPLVYYRQQGGQISGNKWRMIARHLNMLQKYRRRSGATLGVMAYVYTATHFIASIYLRLLRRRL